jgi:multiple antibiotic resistance protein
MTSFYAYAFVCFGSLLSIVDPFAAVPVFLGLVGGQPLRVQRVTALRASLTVFCVLTTFALAGSVIFQFFSITLPAFKIAGGILLFAVALEMMRAHHSDTRATAEEQNEAETRSDVGVIPLGLPLLSGPGAIATVMVLTGKATMPSQRIAVYLAIGAVALLTFLVLRSAGALTRVLGRTGINTIGRIMGLILAAIAIQFVIDGLREAFPLVFAAPT